MTRYPHQYHPQHAWSKPSQVSSISVKNASPSRMPPTPSKPIGLREVVKWCAPGLRLLVYLAPAVLLPFDLYYISHPGPFVYYNSFPALILGPCLLFTSIQLLLLQKGATAYTTGKWQRGVVKGYWTVIATSAIICSLCYGITKKYDCFGIGALILLACALAASRLHELSQSYQPQLNSVRSTQLLTGLADKNVSRADSLDPVMRSTHWHARATAPAISEPNPTLELPAEDEKEIPWWRSDKKAWRATAIASRPLRVLHLLITVMNTVGAIILAHRSIGIRPGERIAISIPDYGTASVNFYCTAGSVQNPGTKPTVWLEGSSSQGITDFLGIQHYLLDHDIASCSYDPPNFGGSDALPISFTDDEDWVPALIRRLDVDPFYSPSDTTRNRTFIGWGSAGMKLAVEHALSDDHASMVIALDPMPDGVEYLIAQMGHDWSNTERLQYRLSDLATRVFQRRLLLSFGIGWGLLSFCKGVTPPTLASYYPETGLATWRAQKMQDPVLARQYHQLLSAASARSEDRYLNITRLPDTMSFHAILSTQVGDISTQDYWRRQKMGVVKSLGGPKYAPVYWCWDCSPNFPIEKAKYTADTIARIIGG